MRKAFSKISVVFLIACLVFSVFVPSIGPIGKVAAESGVNLLSNPNFDSDKSGWLGDFTYKSDGGENDSGCIQAVNWGATWQKVDLKANTTYTYRFYVGGTGGAARFYIQLDNPYDTNNTYVWSSSSTQIGFVEGTVTTTTEGKYFVFLRDWGQDFVTFDSFSLVETEPETETIENYASQTECSVSDWGVVEILLVEPLEANTEYEWSFEFAQAGGTQNVRVKIAGFDVFSGTGFYSQTVESGKFTTGDTAPVSKKIFFFSDGGGNFKVSNLVVKKSDGGEPAECNHANTEVRNAKVATATEDGYTGDTYCLDCGEKIADGEVIPATGEPASTENNANLLENPNFDGNKDGWSGFTYLSTGGENNTGCVEAKNWDAVFQRLELKANTVYSYGFWTSCGNGAARLFIQLDNPWSGGTAVWSGDIKEEMYVSGTFTTTTAGKYWFFLRDWGKDSAKFDSFYLIEGTDLSVLVNNGDNLLKNPLVNMNTDNWNGENFSSQKDAHGGTKGILLNKGGNIYQENLYLSDKTTYTYSLWVKVLSANTNLKISIVNSETSEKVWQGSSADAQSNFIEGTFKPQKSGKYKFIIENTGNYDILLDSFALIKGTEYVRPENGLIPGTEMQPEITDFHTQKFFVSDSSKNIFKYGGFETTPAEGTEWNVESFAGAKEFSLDSSDPRNGNYALKFTGGDEETELRMTLPVKMQTTYRLGAWVKGGYLSTEYPGEVNFGIVTMYNDFITFAENAKKHTSKESAKTSMARDMRWHLVGFEFFTGDCSEVTFVIRGKKALMWFDDFVLAESVYCDKQPEKALTAPVVSDKNTTETPSCAQQDNALSEISLSNANYWKDSIITREAVKVTKDPRNLENEVLYYEEGKRISHSYYSRNVSLKKDTDYTFTAYCRSDVESESAFGLYYRTNWYSPHVFYVSASEPGDWRFVTFNFNTKDYDELVFFIQDNGGNLVLDDVRLFESSKGVALDTVAQLKSMNSALKPIGTENETSNDNQSVKDETSSNNQAAEDETSNYNQLVKDETSNNNQSVMDDEIIEEDSGSGIFEFKDSATGIKLCYEDGREIRSTVSFKSKAVAIDKLPSNALELLEGMKLSAFNLSLIENDKDILPNGRVLIELPVPDGFDGDKCYVYRITDEGKVTNVRARFEDGKLKFTVDKMGTFAVAQTEEANNLIWFIIGGIAALVLIAGVIILLIVIKKKKDNK